MRLFDLGSAHRGLTGVVATVLLSLCGCDSGGGAAAPDKPSTPPEKIGEEIVGKAPPGMKPGSFVVSGSKGAKGIGKATTKTTTPPIRVAPATSSR